MLKIMHTADWHYRRSKAADVFASMDVMEEHADGSDLLIATGDLFDSPVQNTGATQFPGYLKRMARLASKVPIVMVQGTPSHDADGSLDVFETVSERITVLRPGKAYWLTTMGNGKDNILAIDARQNPRAPEYIKALIFGVPEPQKKWLLAADSTMTMDDALRALFLSYAAIRQQYSSLPCILVYHGQVRGARMGNGTSCEHGVSIDDLALVGADYIAMGDIHKPQRVGESRGLHAYYPGAIHPTGDWKDADYKFGFNMVTIGRQLDETSPDDLFGEGQGSTAVTINRIDFPHPMLTKIEGKPNEWYMTPAHAGTRVWLELSGTKQDQAVTDTESILKELLSLGATQGSRVTFKVQGTETVRSAEIQQARKLRAKLKVWADSSKRLLTESHYEMADQIETECAGKGLQVAGGHFSFDKLVLRGARGIYKNQRKDEVTFDLTGLDGGIVGLLGPNGHGKTTLMNNFHPWPTMPNFSAKDGLWKHFRLKDSFREVYITEHTTGLKYRARIKINAVGRTVEYFLDQGDGTNWRPVSGIDGRLAAYEKEVTRIFGTLEMYLRTAFQMQFPTDNYPDLARATKSTKKAIMSALAGLDFYDTYKDTATAHAKETDELVRAKETRLAVLKESSGDIKELTGTLLLGQLTEAAIAKARVEQEQAGKILADIVKALEAKKAEQRVTQDKIRELLDSVSQDGLRITENNRKIEELKQTITARPNAEKTVLCHGEVTQRISELQAEQTRVLQDQQRIMSEYQQRKDVHDQAHREIQKKIDEATRDYATNKAKIDQEIALNKQRGQSLNAELSRPVEDHCPTCRQMLPADALEHVKAERLAKQQELDSLSAKSQELKAKATELESQLNATILDLQAQIDALGVFEPISILPGFDARELTQLQGELTTLNITAARSILDESAGASARIEELTKAIDELNFKISDQHVAIAMLNSTVDKTLDATLAERSKALTDARAEYEKTVADHAKAKADVEQAKREIAKYEQSQVEIEATEKEIKTLQTRAADWRLLELACGQNGIQALELDAINPTTAAITNKLLEEYEDGRYSVRLDTTRDGSKGNQIEDFLIIVIDNKDGGEQEFETLSGGEAVWVRYALQAAMGIIRGQNSLTRFLTGFLDESDSALFPEARIAYFRMLESAHAQSVRHHTVMVSHSSEIQEMLGQKVEVTAL